MIELKGTQANITLKSPSVVNSGGITVDLSNYYTKPEVDSLIPDTSGFSLKSDLPTKISELSNDVGYALKTEIPEGDTIKHIDINSADRLLELEDGLYWIDNLVDIETEDGVNSFSGLMIVYGTTFIFLAHGAFADYDIGTNTWYYDLYAIYSDGFLTEEQVMALIPDVSGFALKSEIPDVSSYTTMNAVEAKGYQTEAQVQALINSALGVIENGTY